MKVLLTAPVCDPSDSAETCQNGRIAKNIQAFLYVYTTRTMSFIQEMYPRTKEFFVMYPSKDSIVSV